jgi:flagellar FliL protein
MATTFSSPSSLAPVATKKRTGGKLMALALAALLAGNAAFWYLHARKVGSAQTPVKAEVPTEMVPLEPLTVNLMGGESFLRIGMALVVEKAAPTGDAALSAKESYAQSPVARDAVLGVLASSTADELLTPAGKDALKEKLKVAIRARAPHLGLKDIYFTEFLIQR